MPMFLLKKKKKKNKCVAPHKVSGIVPCWKDKLLTFSERIIKLLLGSAKSYIGSLIHKMNKILSVSSEMERNHFMAHIRFYSI
jgi:hypothetical protein